MQRLLREIFCISFIIASTLIYGNLIALLMNKIAKEKSSSLLPLQNKNTTLDNYNPNIMVHYPTLLIVVIEDENQHNIMF